MSVVGEGLVRAIWKVVVRGYEERVCKKNG